MGSRRRCRRFMAAVRDQSNLAGRTKASALCGLVFAARLVTTTASRQAGRPPEHPLFADGRIVSGNLLAGRIAKFAIGGASQRANSRVFSRALDPRSTRG